MTSVATERSMACIGCFTLGHVSGSTVPRRPRSRDSEGRKRAQKPEQFGFEDQKPAVCPAADKRGKQLARGWDQITQLLYQSESIRLHWDAL